MQDLLLRPPYGLVLTICLLLGACAGPGNHLGPPIPPPGAPTSDSCQMILVVTPFWGANTGFLRRYQRPTLQSPWEAVGQPIPVETGKSGLGWGRGLHKVPPHETPIKVEGDGRAPAGVFRLSAAFGHSSPAKAAFIRLPYHQVAPGLECVDDRTSSHYNRIVQSGKIANRDWSSSEIMCEYGEPYRWGVVVDHNRPTPLAGGGSCIFLHIWEALGRGTHGCTAMQAADILAVLTWVDQRRKPILVQLPQAEYLARRRPWGLP